MLLHIIDEAERDRVKRPPVRTGGFRWRETAGQSRDPAQSRNVSVMVPPHFRQWRVESSRVAEHGREKSSLLLPHVIFEFDRDLLQQVGKATRRPGVIGVMVFDLPGQRTEAG